MRQERLPGAVYKAWRDNVEQGTALDMETADVIATAIKDWAVAKGATHYSHSFQPWTGGPAEKHDGFLSPTIGGSLSTFSGKRLCHGETDGSSFPSGGLRVTHEARGYTVWDPASPPYVINILGDPVLLVPTLFFSWKGHALDRKIPLLRSIEAVKQTTLKLFAACGLRKHKAIHTDSGIEQEFFLLQAEHVRRRPDIQLCGRTLQGRNPPKGQELSDSYFGPMTAKTLDCVMEMEQRCWELGIPVTTRHREVCPNQYELAPIFENAAIASDHNSLMMLVMETVARKHGLVALFHEKPFAHVNGTGKHNNWSVGSDATGTFFAPGDSPDSNLEFLLSVAAVLRGTDEHAELLRWCISGASNDHRLGGHEAPPSIISIFTGSELANLIKALGDKQTWTPSATRHIDLGIPHLPTLIADASDRNRTSPFAFTGNKFEVRAVGSSQQASASNTVLNLLLADSFRAMEADVRRHVANGAAPKDAAMAVVQDIFKQRRRIIFNGNGYSSEWRAEAKRRGLPNHRTTPDVLDAVSQSKKARDSFASFGILSNEEFDARNTVMYETYGNEINVEAGLLKKMARQHILPVACDTQNTLAATVSTGGKGQRGALTAVATLVSDAYEQACELDSVIRENCEVQDPRQRARHALDKTIPAMAKLRESLDGLEGCVDAAKWPFASYSQMLFHKH